jgi:hypothetical protein
LRHALGISVVGVCAGTLIAMTVVPFVASLLVGVAPADPLILGGAAGFLCMVALISAWLPASTAVHTDAMVHLRQQ